MQCMVGGGKGRFLNIWSFWFTVCLVVVTVFLVTVFSWTNWRRIIPSTKKIWIYPKSNFAQKLRRLRVCAKKCEYVLNYYCWSNMAGCPKVIIFNICEYSVSHLKTQILWRHRPCRRWKRRTTSWHWGTLTVIKARVNLQRCNNYLFEKFYKNIQASELNVFNCWSADHCLSLTFLFFP